MSRTHSYTVTVEWTGNRGEGTANYRAYDRAHRIRSGDKPVLEGSSDPAFRGDARCWNPEELLIASLSACHQLWYLHLAAEAGVIVTAYIDDAVGEMAETPDGGGAFTRVTLRPRVTVQSAPNAVNIAQELHHRAHALCFIARSVNFPVDCQPEAIIG
jgi:organic hydroperoxide reductase OsmC/OhrA